MCPSKSEKGPGTVEVGKSGSGSRVYGEALGRRVSEGTYTCDGTGVDGRGDV